MVTKLPNPRLKALIKKYSKISDYSKFQAGIKRIFKHPVFKVKSIKVIYLNGILQEPIQVTMDKR